MNTTPNTRAWVLAALATAAACSSDTAVAPASRSAGPAPTPSVVRLEVTPRSGTSVPLGSTFTLSAVAVRSDSSRVAVPELRWTSLNPSILIVNPIAGIANAVGVGTVTVLVQDDRVAATVEVTVLAPPGGISKALTLNSYSVIEYAYPEAPDQYYYAPQANVAAAGNRSVVVTQLQFKLPGFDPIPMIGCGGSVPAGATRDLNGESYGDWLFDFFKPGARATTGTVDMTVTFVDDSGATGTIEVQAPIVPGDLPTPGKERPACLEGLAP